jgi:hypothetical protein
LKKEVEAHGPFDGVVGFSQGGVVASVLACMAEAGDFPALKVTGDRRLEGEATKGGRGDVECFRR